MKKGPQKLEIQPGKFFLAEKETDTALVILFQGLWEDLTDSFVAGGIVQSRDSQDKSTLVLMNEADADHFKE